MATTAPEFKFYTASEQIKYVGWLLAASAASNIAKGKRLLPYLPNDAARADALAHGGSLTKLYNEGER